MFVTEAKGEKAGHWTHDDAASPDQDPDRLMVNKESTNRISIGNVIHPRSLPRHVLFNTGFE